MIDQGDVRVSDQDRELTAAALQTHFAAGRLDAQELDERLARTYAAKTRRDLDAVAVDLPVLPPSLVQQRMALTERRKTLQTRAFREAGGGAGTVAVTVVIWAATGQGYFWPLWVMIAMLIPLLKNGWDLYSPWGDMDRLEVELDKKALKRRRRRRAPSARAARAAGR